MKCPYCGQLGDKVVDSRESKEGDVIRLDENIARIGAAVGRLEQQDRSP